MHHRTRWSARPLPIWRFCRRRAAMTRSRPGSAGRLLLRYRSPAAVGKAVCQDVLTHRRADGDAAVGKAPDLRILDSRSCSHSTDQRLARKTITKGMTRRIYPPPSHRRGRQPGGQAVVDKCHRPMRRRIFANLGVEQAESGLAQRKPRRRLRGYGDSEKPASEQSGTFVVSAITSSFLTCRKIHPRASLSFR